VRVERATEHTIGHLTIDQYSIISDIDMPYIE